MIDIYDFTSTFMVIPSLAKHHNNKVWEIFLSYQRTEEKNHGEVFKTI